MEQCISDQENELSLLLAMYPDQNLDSDTSSESAITTVTMERLSVAQADDADSVNSLLFRVEMRGDGEPLDMLSQLPLDHSVELEELPVEGAAGGRGEEEEGALPLSPTAKEFAHAAISASKDLPVYQRPALNRSVSGRRWLVTAQLVYLHPISVYVDLPREYPNVPPTYSITALWLTQEQLAHVCRKLDSLWTEQGAGAPILYTWVQWLETELFDFLDLGVCRTVHLVPAADQSPEDGLVDQRGIPQCPTDIMDAVLIMLNYHRERDAAVFTRTEQECGVCFDSKDGRHFFRLPECAHHFCHLCMAEYTKQHVKEGTVQLISCPSTECDGFVPPDILKTVLDPEEFDRWERLILQRTLEQLGDVGWCPRCGVPCPCDRDDNSRLGECQSCHFCFCTDCGDSWHQGDCGRGGDDAEGAEGGADLKNPDDDRHQKFEKLKQQKQNTLSLAMMKKSTKKCPGCKAPIEKYEGCNKVTCSVCGKFMCWLCGKEIKGYDHFGKKCVLFNTAAPAHMPPAERERQEEAILLEIRLDQQPELIAKLIFCPGCRTQHLKDGRNNHIRCWACRTQLCYLCKQRIKGPITAHFQTPNTCRQHTDD